jgi:hypothetical protein
MSSSYSGSVTARFSHSSVSVTVHISSSHSIAVKTLVFLRDTKQTRASWGADKFTEGSRHGFSVVRNQDSAFGGSDGQHFEVPQALPTCRGRGLEINCKV